MFDIFIRKIQPAEVDGDGLLGQDPVGQAVLGVALPRGPLAELTLLVHLMEMECFCHEFYCL